MSKTYSKLFKSEEITYRLLRDYPEARDNDALLYILYLKNYTKLDKSLSSMDWVELSQTLKSNNIYTPATLFRCRRRLQNKGKFENCVQKKYKRCFFKKLLCKIKKLLKVIRL